MKLPIIAAAALSLSLSAAAQKGQAPLTVQPEFWYSGFQNRELQLMVYGQDISKYKSTVSSDLIESSSDQRVSNKNYLFINLKVATNAPAGKFEILLKDSTSKKKQSITYELKPRTSQQRGFSDKDLMYMIMPDRFANGDPSNDNMPGMLEKADNSNPDGRHGGDIKGIADNVDYFKSLGITALWINPLLENNMPAYSYHGYAITDFYKVDSRFGTNEDYRALCQKLHQNGIKIVQDMVFNHCGSNNIIFKDCPDSTWFHFWPKYTTSNYRGTIVFDPHASKDDYKYMTEGWFDKTMPDIAQENPMALTYLIQNSIWWTEYVGLDGIRMDTYPYNDKNAMNKWCDAMHREFPGMSLLGECWLNDNPFTTYFNGRMNLDGYKCGLDHVTDFPLTFAISKAMNEDEGWDTGLTRIYQNFVSDFNAEHPENYLVFIDNHDVDRIASQMGGDIAKLKIIYSIILTTRGIPCLYYGSELAFESPKPGDGWKRQNMYGGWSGDTKNAFKHENLSSQESDLLSFMTKLGSFRKSTSAFSGKMTHFVPQDGTYVYFRENGSDKVMVIINNSDTDKELSLSRFAECLGGIQSGTDVISGKKIELKNSVKVSKKSPLILSLK